MQKYDAKVQKVQSNHTQPILWSLRYTIFLICLCSCSFVQFGILVCDGPRKTGVLTMLRTFVQDWTCMVCEGRYGNLRRSLLWRQNVFDEKGRVLVRRWTSEETHGCVFGLVIRTWFCVCWRFLERHVWCFLLRTDVQLRRLLMMQLPTAIHLAVYNVGSYKESFPAAFWMTVLVLCIIRRYFRVSFSPSTVL